MRPCSICRGTGWRRDGLQCVDCWNGLVCDACGDDPVFCDCDDWARPRGATTSVPIGGGRLTPEQYRAEQIAHGVCQLLALGEGVEVMIEAQPEDRGGQRGSVEMLRRAYLAARR